MSSIESADGGSQMNVEEEDDGGPAVPRGEGAVHDFAGALRAGVVDERLAALRVA